MIYFTRKESNGRWTLRSQTGAIIDWFDTHKAARRAWDRYMEDNHP